MNMGEESKLTALIRLKRPFARHPMVYFHVKLHPQLLINVAKYLDKTGITQTEFFTYLLADADEMTMPKARRLPKRSHGASYFQVQVPGAVLIPIKRWRKLYRLSYTEILTHVLEQFCLANSLPVPPPLQSFNEYKRTRKKIGRPKKHVEPTENQSSTTPKAS